MNIIDFLKNPKKYISEANKQAERNGIKDYGKEGWKDVKVRRQKSLEESKQYMR